MWRRFGPYHHARLRVSAERFRAGGGELIGVEVVARSGLHQWRREPNGSELITLFADERLESLSRRHIFTSMRRLLDRLDPDAVIVPAYSTAEAQAGLTWARDRRRPAVVMTATGRADAPRSPLRERAKRAIVSQFDAALAGGNPQARYIHELGIPQDRVFIPYDVVDNDFFARGAAAARADPGSSAHLPGLGGGLFFLASGRFIARKNFPMLLRAYGRYRADAQEDAWGLVILGDGPQRAALAALADEVAPPGSVTFPGYRQVDELGAYYGAAGALVHPPLVEQWGLVVNEAMAAGLPVLVSRSAGAAEDLVAEGENGMTFDPEDVSELTEAMLTIAAPGTERGAMAAASRERVAGWSLERFADGLWRAVDAGRSSADRPLAAPVRFLVWINQFAPAPILRWRSVEP